jgi:cytochrome oxidase Cu insertion factor (SCO1/SenC/PrrC family)
MNQSQLGPAGQRFTLIALCTVFVAPLIGAWIVFNYTEVGRNDQGVNHGELITPPRIVGDLALTDPARPDARPRLYGRWNLVYLAAARCDPVCAGKLDMMRQILLALGPDAQRVQRVVFITENAAPALNESLATEFPGLLLAPDTNQLVERFKLTESERPLNLRRLYLVDPQGNLFMVYPERTETAGIIKDLKRLLKYSRVG